MTEDDFEATNMTTLVEFTLNGQQYFSGVGGATRFRYHTPPVPALIVPSSGPAGGGTTVLIELGNETIARDGTLVPPPAGGEPLCQFNEDIVPATIVEGPQDTLICVTPSETAFEAGVQGLPVPLELVGSARRLGAGPTEYLDLTEWERGPMKRTEDQGAAVLRFPDPDAEADAKPVVGDPGGPGPPPWIAVALRVRFEGKGAFSGLSLSYGDLPLNSNMVSPERAERRRTSHEDGLFPEGSMVTTRPDELLTLGAFGLGGGLRLSLRTTRSKDRRSMVQEIHEQLLDLVYAGKPIKTVVVDPPVHEAEIQITVLYDPNGLHVSFDGQPIVESVIIPGWNPRPHWALGVGARTSLSNGSFIGVDRYTITKFHVRRRS
jgi:hypothetical protein